MCSQFTQPTCSWHVCQLQRVLNRFKYIPFLLHVCVCHPLRKLSIKKSAIAHFSPSESAARLGQNALRISEARLDSYKTLPQYIFPSGLRHTSAGLATIVKSAKLAFSNLRNFSSPFLQPTRTTNHIIVGEQGSRIHILWVSRLLRLVISKVIYDELLNHQNTRHLILPQDGLCFW